MKMKNVFKAAVAVIALVGGSQAAWAADNATADATATVVTPIAVTKTTDMNFGKFSSGTGGGTVTLTAAGTTVRSKTGDNVILAGGTPTAAKFHVTGTADAAYVVTLPASAATLTSGSDTMSVDTFTDNLTDHGGTLASGADDFYVGATLHASADQAAGTYTGSFSVTVAYN